MRIAVASDHAGWSLKEEIKEILAGHDVSDFGTGDSTACDLPDFVYPAALAVGEARADRGIFVDGVGYGSALIANKVHGVREVIQAAGASLLYLPPYSPDFNPIEMTFSKLKALLRAAAARTMPDLWQAIANALKRFSPDECQNYLAAAGYDAT